jgi:hypothetical protein
MKTPRRWLPTQFSLRTLLLLTFVCACGARPAARWMEAHRATQRFNEVVEKEHDDAATTLDLVISGRTKYQAVCNAPFADLDQAKQEYEIALFFAVSIPQGGPYDFCTSKTEAVQQFLIAEYYEWFDQGFPDHRRDAEFQALLVEAIPQARNTRQEWVTTEKNRKSPKDG